MPVLSSLTRVRIFGIAILTISKLESPSAGLKTSSEEPEGGIWHPDGHGRIGEKKHSPGNLVTVLKGRG